MKFGWITSLAVHGSIALMMLASFGTGKNLDAIDDAPIAVDIISVAEFEQVGKKKVEDLTTKKAVAPPKEAPKPIVKPKPKPKEKPKPKPEQDNNQLVALLDKLKTEPEPENLLDLLDADISIGEEQLGALSSENLEDVEVASLSQFEFIAVKKRMESCWSIPAGAQDAGNVVVRVNFKLNRNAEVVGNPRVINSMPNPSFNVMAASAVRAIIECGPYDMLPPEKYDVWNNFTMEFDPRTMFGG